MDYFRGKTLRNDADHGAIRGRDASTAVGFCFFAEDPDVALHRLSGIVDLDCCITVEVSEDLVRPCTGRYPNWVRPGVQDGSVQVEEWCATEYDRRRFRLVSVTGKYRNYAPGASALRRLLPGVFI